MQKMQFIQQQRSSGLGGFMSGMNKPAGGVVQKDLNAGMSFGKTE
jgi:hypothetical protein